VPGGLPVARILHCRARARPARAGADHAARATALEQAVRRLNWGCGPAPAPGWINSDLLQAPGIDLSCDIREGLPLESESVQYAVGIHGLQDLPYLDVVPALRELRRVLAPGGVLRLGLPDLERAIAAYLRDDPSYFYIPDEEAATISGKLIIQMTWYGSNRMMFTYEFARELLLRAGFRDVLRCAFRETASRYPEIVAFDNRERESLFVEAVR
jgi:predicted SAM-dependent methyltransferase